MRTILKTLPILALLAGCEEPVSTGETSEPRASTKRTSAAPPVQTGTAQQAPAQNTAQPTPSEETPPPDPTPAETTEDDETASNTDDGDDTSPGGRRQEVPSGSIDVAGPGDIPSSIGGGTGPVCDCPETHPTDNNRLSADVTTRVGSQVDAQVSVSGADLGSVRDAVSGLGAAGLPGQ